VGLGVNPIAVLIAAAVTFGFFVFFLQKIWAARRRPIAAGAEVLIGSSGEAREELAPEGLVFVRGALWRAVAADKPIPAGSAVQVVGRRGLQLEVVPGVAEATREKT
jgi:membrane-bound serine protease (ClpP class)